jgi:hypothetical protein
MFEMEGYR